MRSECRRCELSPICLVKGLAAILQNLVWCHVCGRMYLRLEMDNYKPASPLCVAFELRQAAMNGRRTVVIEGVTWHHKGRICEECQQKEEEKKDELRRMSFEERLLKNRP